MSSPGGHEDVRAHRVPLDEPTGRPERPADLVLDRPGASRARAAVAAAGILLAIAPFLPWVNVVVLGSVSLDGAFRLVGHSFLSWIVMTPGLGAVVIAMLVRRHLKSAVIVTAVFAAVLDGGIAASTLHDLSATDGFASVGVGLILAGLGVLLLVLGAVVIRTTAPLEAQGRALRAWGWVLVPLGVPAIALLVVTQLNLSACVSRTAIYPGTCSLDYGLRGFGAVLAGISILGIALLVAGLRRRNRQLANAAFTQQSHTTDANAPGFHRP
ncbi:MAG: hypothetical protein ACYCSF_08130 [Acidimicrobiales bacterium]